MSYSMRCRKKKCIQNSGRKIWSEGENLTHNSR
jgi:hypothetical protein